PERRSVWPAVYPRLLELVRRHRSTIVFANARRLAERLAARLNDLAGELLDFLAPQAERARIRLRREFAPDLPPVQVDPNLMRQAILNLLVNAQQAMPHGGEITVRTESNGQHVRLQVRDNGPGIPVEHRDKIFSLYFSTKPGGTGLGLPMVKKIVEEHGGLVEVDSRPGEGATFTLCLKKSAS
ncbi:MAG: sensor histidine kinase, partial [Planctomycetota bacterium]